MYVQVKKPPKHISLRVIKSMRNTQRVFPNGVCYTHSAVDKTDLHQLHKLETNIIEAIESAIQQSGHRIQNEFFTKQLDCTAIQFELMFDDRLRQRECETTKYAQVPVSCHFAECNILKPKLDWVASILRLRKICSLSSI